MKPKKCGKMLTEKQCFSIYGKVGDEANMVIITLPYPMKLSWTPITVTKMKVHKLAAPKVRKMLGEVLAHYGITKIRKLGLDILGGCFSYRKMRGGSEWSRHSWAIAIDLNPNFNRLEQNNKTAQFAHPDYDKFWDIVYSNGFLSMGIEYNYDYMHIELAPPK